MAIYELGKDNIRPISETTFESEKIKERYDLQRLLRDRIEVIDPDLLIIAEEFGDWEDSKKRIDLLALDKNANLVVIELKRTLDGGYMDLQALRYAAMISTMTYENVVNTYRDYLRKIGREDNAQEFILNFLEWEDPQEDKFAQDVLVILVSAEFSKELTTTVMWLNTRDMNIRCIRLKPYNLDGRIIIDAQQIISLPEAEEYQIKVRNKDIKERSARITKASLSDVLNEIKTKCSEDVVRVVDDLCSWLQPKVDGFFPVSKGFAEILKVGDKPYYFFKIRTDGNIEIWFQYLSWKPPFDDESLRNELRERLCKIPGVSIDANRIAGKPCFPLVMLSKKEAMDIFKETFQWVFDTIQK